MTSNEIFLLQPDKNRRKEKAVPVRSAGRLAVKENTKREQSGKGRPRVGEKEREMADLLVLLRPAKSLQNSAASAEKT